QYFAEQVTADLARVAIEELAGERPDLGRIECWFSFRHLRLLSPAAHLRRNSETGRDRAMQGVSTLVPVVFCWPTIAGNRASYKQRAAVENLLLREGLCSATQ